MTNVLSGAPCGLLAVRYLRRKLDDRIDSDIQKGIRIVSRILLERFGGSANFHRSPGVKHRQARHLRYLQQVLSEDREASEWIDHLT